jgi:hypothetical protein
MHHVYQHGAIRSHLMHHLYRHGAMRSHLSVRLLARMASEEPSEGGETHMLGGDGGTGCDGGS